MFLTYDEGNENPYEYTELLFTKQDVLVNIGERSYGRNRTIALAAMKELKKLSASDFPLLTLYTTTDYEIYLFSQNKGDN